MTWRRRRAPSLPAAWHIATGSRGKSGVTQGPSGAASSSAGPTGCSCALTPTLRAANGRPCRISAQNGSLSGERDQVALHAGGLDGLFKALIDLVQVAANAQQQAARANR